LSNGGFARTDAKPKPAQPKRIHANHSFFSSVLPFPCPHNKEFILILDFYYQKFVGVSMVSLDKEWNFLKKEIEVLHLLSLLQAYIKRKK